MKVNEKATAALDKVFEALTTEVERKELSSPERVAALAEAITALTPLVLSLR